MNAADLRYMQDSIQAATLNARAYTGRQGLSVALNDKGVQILEATEVRVNGRPKLQYEAVSEVFPMAEWQKVCRALRDLKRK